MSFLNSYDEELSNIFLKRLNDNEINFSNKLGLSNGIILFIQSLDKTPLFINGDLNLSLYTTSVLAHEFGHLYEYEIAKKSITESHFFVSVSSIYHEVSSQFFRYLFLNYIRDNNIYISNVDILFSRYYLMFLDYIIGLNFICNNDVVLDRDLNVESSDKLLQFLSDIREQFNCYNIVSDNVINYKDSFIYGIGSLFGIHLFDTYKNDPIGFKKEFKNAMINYPKIGIEAFRNLGITREIFEDGSVLKKVLKKQQ